MYYKTVIIIGSGTIACECSKVLKEMSVKHFVMENNPQSISMLMAQCKKSRITMIERRNSSIEEALLKYAKGNTLIISANNEHIFKKEIFHKNMTIINFHNSLLPDYRGVNIPTWVIFNQEKYTGATWHYIDEKIDNGNIICQSKFVINEFDTAFDITRIAMNEGTILFKKFIGNFLEIPDIGMQNDSALCNHVYRRADLPADGVIVENMEPELIERLLRAFDYGPIAYVPRPRLREDKKEKQILHYRIYKNDKLVVGTENWKSEKRIVKNDYCFEFLFCRE